LWLAEADYCFEIPFHQEAQAIRAKTGSLSHIREMSRYVETSRYGPVAFSFLVNNFAAPTVEVS
jgi:D-alanyl-D-alanine carboxypeptidase